LLRQQARKSMRNNMLGDFPRQDRPARDAFEFSAFFADRPELEG
jgi:hypothetical protein